MLHIPDHLHNLDTSELDAYAAEWDAWVALCRGEAIPPAVPNELMRTPVLSLDIGGGICRQIVLYPYQEEVGAPPELIGRCEAYALGDVSIELDDNLDFFRKIGLIIGEYEFNHNFTAAEMLPVATLLRNDTVFAALQRWAAEDAAAPVAE